MTSTISVSSLLDIEVSKLLKEKSKSSSKSLSTPALPSSPIKSIVGEGAAVLKSETK